MHLSVCRVRSLLLCHGSCQFQPLSFLLLKLFILFIFPFFFFPLGKFLYTLSCFLFSFFPFLSSSLLSQLSASCDSLLASSSLFLASSSSTFFYSAWPLPPLVVIFFLNLLFNADIFSAFLKVSSSLSQWFIYSKCTFASLQCSTTLF